MTTEIIEKLADYISNNNVSKKNDIQIFNNWATETGVILKNPSDISFILKLISDLKNIEKIPFSKTKII